ncbi:hypothetical protein KVV02_001925 [Mortierella alpina]|uniref:Uncharacterized protein n=1 Tax=Mortierella alpina TaxID=64518 RepID=A0A9P8AAF5_MORAP|nr:hypothetical protein KVV02_001925 [Mortierella alpina]
MTPAKIPTGVITTGTRVFSTASRRPSSIGFGLTTRLEKAASWFGSRQTPPQQAQSLPATQPQQHMAAALFSTSGISNRSSKEEEDLYQALTVSFRTRLAEQIHKPEDGYKAVIEHWTAHTQKDALTRQRTRARKERIAAAVKHKDIVWIEREQERLEMEANGTSDDHFYIIQGWIKCGELKRATLAFENMESMSVPLTIRTLAALTRAHARSGNMAIAGAMVQKMKDLKLHPSSIYDMSALLEYYIKMTPASAPSTAASPIQVSTSAHTAESRRTDPSHEQVQEIWKAIEPQLQLSTSAATNNNVSFAYRTYLGYLVNRAHDLESAVELIERMAAKNLSPELERYQKSALSIIKRLSKHGYFTELKKLMDQRDAALAKSLPQTTWSDLLETTMAKGENQTARWLYNDMIRYGIQPSIKSKKLFSELQLRGGTADRGGPAVARAGSGTKAEDADILSILFSRHTKPALS